MPQDRGTPAEQALVAFEDAAAPRSARPSAEARLDFAVEGVERRILMPFAAGVVAC